MNEILSHLGVEVVSEAELGVRIEVEETGETFHRQRPPESDGGDAGDRACPLWRTTPPLRDALNGGPGVYSALRRRGTGRQGTPHAAPRDAARADRPRRALPHLHRLRVPRTATSWCARVSARAPSRSRRWARAASATTPYSLCLSCARPSASSRRRKRRPSRHRGKALRAFAAALDDYLKGNE